ncbi:hypothetical protein [Burkholderia cepacia]|uniref:hypothetical protein n=1 Tax=Burkholderia cepacia TaxID=292 RepID=UPI001785C78A|nr:hypothetical protein [Burkholderia cepacia]
MFFKNRNARRGHVVPASLRKRILSIMRRAHRVLGVNRDNLGIGQMTVGGSGKGIVLSQGNSAVLSSAAAGVAAAALAAFSPHAQAQTLTWRATPPTAEVSDLNNWSPGGLIRYYILFSLVKVRQQI